MPNRFQQSAPPSLGKIYPGLPIGPFGVSPYIRPERDRRSDAAPGLQSWFVGLLRALRSLRAQLIMRSEASPIETAAKRKTASLPCP